jgi:hypothetical protein
MAMIRKTPTSFSESIEAFGHRPRRLLGMSSEG